MVELLERLERHGSLSDKDRAALKGLGRNRRTFRRGEVISPRGGSSCPLMVLHSGIVGSRVLGAGGEPQLMRLHFAGDLMGAANMAIVVSQDELAGIRDGAVSDVRREDLRALFHQAPEVAMLLFVCAEEDRLELIGRLCGLGRETAVRRVARLLVRLRESDDRDGAAAVVRIPLSQVEFGQLAGLSRIHVQRVIKILTAAGGIAWRRGGLEIVDTAVLQGLADASEAPAAAST